MALPLEQQARYWGIGLAIAVLFFWLFGSVLLPFLAGMALAYFLDPAADRLEAMGASRVWATAIIAIIAFLVVILIVGAVVPAVIQQAIGLIEAAPSYAQQLRGFIETRFPSLNSENGLVMQGLDSFASTLQQSSGRLANILLASAIGIVDTLVFLVIAPVVAFYMLLDWDRMVARVDSWLPLDHRPTLRRLASEIDGVLAGFVRGQLTVCFILGIFYAVALMLVGLNYGLVVGIIAGLLTFIPYVGALIGGALSIGLALVQFWNTPELIVLTAAIFLVGQTVEGNILTPRLVGTSVGLHPVWLLFALSAFGALMGFTGMLIAVPVAAIIGVLSRFGIEQYLTGRLYLGETGKAVEDEDG